MSYEQSNFIRVERAALNPEHLEGVRAIVCSEGERVLGVSFPATIGRLASSADGPSMVYTPVSSSPLDVVPRSDLRLILARLGWDAHQNGGGQPAYVRRRIEAASRRGGPPLALRDVLNAVSNTRGFDPTIPLSVCLDRLESVSVGDVTVLALKPRADDPATELLLEQSGLSREILARYALRASHAADPRIDASVPLAVISAAPRAGDANLQRLVEGTNEIIGAHPVYVDVGAVAISTGESG